MIKALELVVFIMLIKIQKNIIADLNSLLTSISKLLIITLRQKFGLMRKMWKKLLQYSVVLIRKPKFDLKELIHFHSLLFLLIKSNYFTIQWIKTCDQTCFSNQNRSRAGELNGTSGLTLTFFNSLFFHQ